MNHFHVAGLHTGVLMLFSLSWAMGFPSSSLALQTVSESSKVTATTNAIGPTSLDLHGMESDDPVAIAQGEGGDFSYQIWQEAQASEYYLFIWGSESVPAQDAVRGLEHTIMPASIDKPVVSYNFTSASEAIDFFTCRYARERLASCSMTTMSSISYDVPETCAFPWIACKEP